MVEVPCGTYCRTCVYDVLHCNVQVLTDSVLSRMESCKVKVSWNRNAAYCLQILRRQEQCEQRQKKLTSFVQRGNESSTSSYQSLLDCQSTF